MSRIAVVTGANKGIGLETARQLARAGVHVIVAARSVDKAAAAVATSSVTPARTPRSLKPRALPCCMSHARSARPAAGGIVTTASSSTDAPGTSTRVIMAWAGNSSPLARRPRIAVQIGRAHV